MVEVKDVLMRERQLMMVMKVMEEQTATRKWKIISEW